MNTNCARCNINFGTHKCESHPVDYFCKVCCFDRRNFHEGQTLVYRDHGPWCSKLKLCKKDTMSAKPGMKVKIGHDTVHFAGNNTYIDVIWDRNETTQMNGSYIPTHFEIVE